MLITSIMAHLQMEWIQKAFIAYMASPSALISVDRMHIFHVCFQIFVVFESFLTIVASHRCFIMLSNVLFDIFAHVPIEGEMRWLFNLNKVNYGIHRLPRTTNRTLRLIRIAVMVGLMVVQ